MKKQVVFLFVASLLLFSLAARTQELIAFKDANGKWGYKNKARVVVVPAKYQEAGSFGYESLAPVRLNNKWGLIDKNGKEVVSPKYDRLGKDKVVMFVGGHLEVQQNGKWGLIDEKGTEVVPAKYQDVHVSDNNKGYFSVEQAGKWGFVNARGQTVIPFKYDDASYFENNIAIVQLNEKWGAIDAADKVIIPFQYDDLEYTYQFDKPLDWLEAQQAGKWGFIASNGTVKIPLIYQEIREYKVNYGDNPKDRTLLAPEGHFIDGIDMVERNGKWGAVDLKGNEVIPVRYDDIVNEEDHNILMKGARWYKVKLGGKWGLLDPAGNELIAPRYATAFFQYDNDAMKKLAASKKKDNPAPVATTEPEKDKSPATTKAPVSVKPNVTGIKGIVDPDLVGTWKYHDEPMNFNGYYIFRADGTYDYWSDMITPTAPPPTDENYWRVNGDDLQLAYKYNQKIVHNKILKRNDPQSNRPALLIEWGTNGNYRTYFSTAAKPLWATNGATPASGNKVEPTLTKILEPPVHLNGVVDPSLIGLWKYTQGKMDYFIDMKADGTYDTWNSSKPKKLKVYWRINNAVMETYFEGTGVQRYGFKKVNDLANAKPTIILEWATYYPVADKEMWK